ncbi:ABC transporter substrate-binding protein [Bilifractor porci]|uniref:ABC transporter substrate-binding protein n=1 Tax=Bilifractor porci TaxID=2606636 RepID=A0A7X2P7L3_9FIRM|nr:ABC transporter substrate-binding protein [Bilifractor porci]MST81276.1 ABC transporter substrate-binding protein [Bilifractor porci]
MRKNGRWKEKILAAGLALAMAAGLGACGSASGSASSGSSVTGTSGAAVSGSTDAAAVQTGDDIVNIAFTDTVGTVNPLNMDVTFINYYATSMMFLPLVSFNNKYEPDYLLAESITTDDNQTFKVKLKDNAAWSDGEPVTSDDVIYTILKFTCPAVANPNFDFTPFKGFNDDGTSPEGATEIEGIHKTDDKNLEFICKEHMSLNTFLNNVATWVCILPKHAIEDIPDDQLLTDSWFSHPDVVDGPYFLDDYDPAHYVSYHANENYFEGAPKIPKINFRIMQGSEILAGLKSGEIDMVHPSSSIPIEDREAVENLEGFTTKYTDNIINEMTLFNTSKEYLSDPKVRQAIIYAIDRDTIVKQLLNGQGEVTDGFICSGSPFYNEGKTKLSYDPEKAKQLLEEAGWDSSQTLQYYVSSSDSTAVKAAQLVQQYLQNVGVKIEINTVDFATLMTIGGTDEEDFFSVQYTITPNDYWADIKNLIDVQDFSWSGGYYNEKVDADLAKTQETTDDTELKNLYNEIEEQVIEDAPMFPMYFQSNLGVVSDRLKNVTPSFYGAFDNIQEWSV